LSEGVKELWKSPTKAAPLEWCLSKEEVKHSTFSHYLSEDTSFIFEVFARYSFVEESKLFSAHFVPLHAYAMMSLAGRTKIDLQFGEDKVSSKKHTTSAVLLSIRPYEKRKKRK